MYTWEQGLDIDLQRLYMHAKYIYISQSLVCPPPCHLAMTFVSNKGPHSNITHLTLLNGVSNSPSICAAWKKSWSSTQKAQFELPKID